MTKKILHLNLYGEHFDQVLAEIKKEEYRGLTPYWAKRLLDVSGKCYRPISFESTLLDDLCYWLKSGSVYPCVVFKRYGVKGFKSYTHIMFSNGFQKDRRQMLIEFNGIDISKGNVDWGAIPEVLNFNIKLGAIVERIRC